MRMHKRCVRQPSFRAPRCQRAALAELHCHPPAAVVEALEQRVCLSALFVPGPGSPISLGDVAGDIVAGDFNGNGSPDLAINFVASPFMGVLVGNGEGGFAPAPGSPLNLGGGPRGDPVQAVAADFNGDGKLDLAVADITIPGDLGSVSVLLGNGDGTFTPAPGPPAALGFGPLGMAVVDFNGRAGLVVPNYTDDDLSVLLGNGDGTFTPAPGSPIQLGQSPTAIALGDFDGDGNLDVAVASNSQVSVLVGNGAGEFRPAPGRPFQIGYALAGVGYPHIAVGDFNGNGKLDLALADGNRMSVLMGKGNGLFARAPGPQINFGPNAELSTIVEGDFTGNGRCDLAVSDLGNNNVHVLLGNGKGTFVNASGSPFAAGNGTDDMAGIDLAGDGEPDLVVGDDHGETLSVLRNTTPAGPLTGTLGAALSEDLPATITVGVKNSGTVAVTVIASAGKPVNGRVSVALYASPDASLFDATQVTAQITQRVSLKAGASETLRVPVSLFPTAPPGAYHLIAAVGAPDGSTTAAAGPSVTIVRPVVTVLASSISGSPANLAPGKNLTLGMTLRNEGNIPAAGTTRVTISLSPDVSGAGSHAVATVPLRVKLAPGKSKPYRLRFAVPRATAAGSYYLVASLNVSALGDMNSADGIAVSAMSITVS